MSPNSQSLEPALEGEGELFVPGFVTEEEIAALTVSFYSIINAAPNLEKPIPSSIECSKLPQVPDQLSDADRAQLYAVGQDVQRRCLVVNLGGLSPTAFAAVAAHLPNLLESQDEDGQAAMAEGLAALLHQRQLPCSTVAESILPLVLRRATDVKQCPTLQDAWLECFKEIVPALDWHSLRSKVVPAVLRLGIGTGGRGGSGREAPARCLYARLLGALAPAVPQDAVESVLLRPAVDLCQDVDAEVRRAMCTQLPLLVAALAASSGTGNAALDVQSPVGLPGAVAASGTPPVAPLLAGTPAGAVAASKAVAKLLEEAALLLEDEEVTTRVAAWRMVAELLRRDLVGLAHRRGLLSHFLAQCQVPDSHVEMHRSLTESFGTLISRLVADMDGEGDINTALSCFRAMAWRHDARTRRNCAAAFLPTLKAATARRFASHLHDTLLRLVSDPEVEVRLVLVEAPLHEVAAVLGRERCVQYLRPSVIALLCDEDREVQGAMAAQLVPLMEQFNISIPELRDKVFGELARALLEVEAGSGRDWRLQLDLLRAIAELPKYHDKDLLHDQLLPVALKCLAEGPAALMGPAADAIVAIWRCKSRKPQQRAALYGRLVREFAQGRGWRQRAAFLELCSAALRRFSGSFVKVHLLGPCSLLAFDPVPNVQLRVCGLLPAFKQTISLPGDLPELEKLNGAMSHLSSSTDKDVSEAAAQVSQAYRQKAVRMPFGYTSPGVEGSPATGAPDKEEALKLLWERELVFDQDMLDRIRAEMETYDKARRPPPPPALLLPLPVPSSDAPVSALPPRPRTSFVSGSKEQLAASRSLSTGPSKAGKLTGAGSSASPPTTARVGQAAGLGTASAALQRRSTEDGHSPRAQQAQQHKGLRPTRTSTEPEPLPSTSRGAPSKAGGSTPAAAAGGAARPGQRHSIVGPAVRTCSDRRPSILSQPRRATSTGVVTARQDRSEGPTPVGSPAVSRANSRGNSPARAASKRLSIADAGSGSRSSDSGQGRGAIATGPASRTPGVTVRRSSAVAVELTRPARLSVGSAPTGISTSGGSKPPAVESMQQPSKASAAGSSSGVGEPVQQPSKASAAGSGSGVRESVQQPSKAANGPNSTPAQQKKAGEKFLIGAVRPRIK